jgi:Tol biopolymer transport system component
VQKTLAWFGWREPTQLFRGGSALDTKDLGALEVWLMDTKGRASRLTSDRGYQTPVFAPDGRRLAAIHAGKIRILQVRARPSDKDRDLSVGTSPRYLLGWTDKGIAVLTDESSIVAVDPETGERKTVAEAVTDPELDALVTASRTCGAATVMQSYLPGFAYAVAARYDVGVRFAATSRTKMLTDKSSRRINAQPAFSADCKRIAFISK